jgi:predicted RNA polymerase sigma factor
VPEGELNQLKSPSQLLQYYTDKVATLALNQPIPSPSIRAMIRYFYQQKKTAEIADFMTQVKHMLPASEAAFVAMYASYAGHFDSPQSGLKILQKAERRFAGSVDYLKSIAVLYEQLKKPQQAFEYYDNALQLAKKQQARQWQINILEAKLLATKG